MSIIPISPRTMKRQWAGTLLMVVASFHVLFVLILGSGVIKSPQMTELVGDQIPLLMMRPGFGSDQPANLLLLTLFWSMFFGLTMFVLGVLIRSLEGRGQHVPRVVGGLLILLCVGGGILVPASGFWLALVPAVLIAKGEKQVSV